MTRFPLPNLLKRRKPKYGPTIPTMAVNSLRRHGIELEDTPNYTDDQLLQVHNFGRQCLRWVRENEPDGRPYLEEQTTA